MRNKGTCHPHMESPGGHSSRSWARPASEAMSFILRGVAEVQRLGPSSALFHDTLMGSWIASGTARTWVVFHKECQQQRHWRVKAPRHNTDHTLRRHSNRDTKRWRYTERRGKKWRSSIPCSLPKCPWQLALGRVKVWSRGWRGSKPVGSFFYCLPKHIRRNPNQKWSSWVSQHSNLRCQC